MEKRAVRSAWRPALTGALVLAAVWLMRRALWALGVQLLGGYGLMALALPLCRLMEKRLPAGWAAGCSLLAVGMAAAAVLLGLIPPLVEQLRQVAGSLPTLLAWAEEWLGRGQVLLEQRGVNLSGVQEELLSLVSERAGGLVSMAAGFATQLARGIGKLFLAPLIAFYLLRDRGKIAAWLMLVIPVRWRARAVRAAREMRREAAGFLRGQLLVSALVAVLTALGLMAVGTSGWLVLGILMGVMELVPYVGPVAAGVPAVLMGLRGGLGQAALTLAVLLAVQQLEGTILSPRLLAGATRLHPLAVLLCVSAGGIFAGTIGMILALPVVVSVRGALRGLR